MYFDNITNTDVMKYPKPYIRNFNIKLSDILDSTNNLFIVEEITPTIYKIFPLFNCKSIISTNENDKIFENRLIICNKDVDNETFISFISDENEPISEYYSQVDYYPLNTVLTDNGYNRFVDLLRLNGNISENIRIQPVNITTEYGNLDFEIIGEFLDNGIKITNETILKCKLTNPQCHYVNYRLDLSVLRLANPNIEYDDPIYEPTIIPLSIILENGSYIDIDISELQEDDIILYDCVLNLVPLPVIQDWVNSIILTSTPSIIQSGDVATLSATCYDNGGVTVKSGHVVEFFEEYTPKLILNSTKNIIQSGDTNNLNIKLVDEADGSIISLNGLTVRLYEEYEPVLNLSSNNSIIQSGDTSDIKITLKDSSDGNIISLEGLTVRIYEEYNPNISLNANPSIIQSGDTSVISATVKDDDGNLIVGETVEFYIDE